MSKKLLFNFNREVIQNYTYVKYVGTVITATNTLEKPIKSATLKGSTKYRDIDTGDILDTFDETKNLELVSVKVPVLTTKTSILDSLNNYTVKAGRSWVGKEELGHSQLVGVGDNNVIFKHTGSSIRGFMIQGIPYNKKGKISLTLRHVNQPEGFSGSLFCNITTFKEGNYVFQTGNNPMTYNSNAGLYSFTTSLTQEFDSLWVTSGIYNTNNVMGEHEFELILSDSIVSDTTYKSNILTVNEPVEPRGIGEVKDELNSLTGEYVRRIGEVVLDGSLRAEGMYNHVGKTNGFYFPLNTIQLKSTHNEDVPKMVICDKFRVTNNEYQWMNGVWLDEEFLSATLDGRIAIRLLTTKASTKDELHQYLSQNPITVYYQLATESVKTVDLSILDQNGNKVSSISSFNDTTHITASSETIPPIFEGYLATKEG